MNLEHALELAERGRGTTHPNPVVGCVLLRGDKVVGEAWHEVTGGAHAEVLALREAGASLLVAGSSIFGREDLTRAYRRLVQELS